MKAFVILFLTLNFLHTPLRAADDCLTSVELYSQTVFLHKFRNPISQNRLSVFKSSQNSHYEPYAGVWWDHDRKSDSEETFTDAQVSPFAGLRSKIWGPSVLSSRAFGEARFVHRTKAFADERAKNTYEIRGGFLGYGLHHFTERFFIENYYALFYTRLYDSRIIFQGWLRQGADLGLGFDIFNEIFFDTFDQTRGRDGTLDLRPGIRFQKKFSSGAIQLLHQRLHHFSNLDFSGRNESRTTLVVGWYFQ